MPSNADEMDPLALFGAWFAEAEAAEPDNPEAMTLASAGSAGRPSARMVLLKEWGADGFVFYTNLDSRKGRELAENPHAALLFYWKSLARQVRIEGPASQIADARADAYFSTRPRMTRLGAWASRQSQVMEGGRHEFERALAKVTARFLGKAVPRPPRWSGFSVRPEVFEFWEEGRFRLHRRRRFRRTGKDGWILEHLFP